MIMTESKMKDYINRIGRCELYDELKDMKNPLYNIPDSRYLKAVLVSLVELGFDEDWVTSTFKEALYEKYYGEDYICY